MTRKRSICVQHRLQHQFFLLFLLPFPFFLPFFLRAGCPLAIMLSTTTDTSGQKGCDDPDDLT
jgi:hypothetical protein